MARTAVMVLTGSSGPGLQNPVQLAGMLTLFTYKVQWGAARMCLQSTSIAIYLLLPWSTCTVSGRMIVFKARKV